MRTYLHRTPAAAASRHEPASNSQAPRGSQNVEVARDRRDLRIAIALCGIAVLGTVLRLQGLGSQSFWLDEASTRMVVGGSLASAWHLFSISESAPPLYYLVLWGWTHLLGTSDTALRSLSAIAGIATIPVVYAAARRLAGSYAGLIAAALTACNPFLVWYSQEARAYSLYALLSALSFLLFLRARDDRTGRSVAAWAVVSAAAIATHYLAAVLVAAEGGWLLATGQKVRKSVTAALIALAAGTAALLPHALHQRYLQQWITETPLGERARELPTTALVGITDPPGLVVPAALALACASLVLLVLRGSIRDKRGAMLTAGLTLAVVGAVALGALIGPDELLARNLLTVWPLFAITIAIGCATRRSRAVGTVLAVALCGIGLGVIAEWKSDVRLQRVDWRAAAELIGAPRDRVIAVPAPNQRLALIQYLTDHGGHAELVTRPPRTREVDLLTYRTPDRGDNCYSGIGCEMPDAKLTGYSAPSGFHLTERASAGLFVLARYRAPGESPVRMHIQRSWAGYLRTSIVER